MNPINIGHGRLSFSPDVGSPDSEYAWSTIVGPGTITINYENQNMAMAASFGDYVTWSINHKADLDDAIGHCIAIEKIVEKIMADFPATDKPALAAAINASMLPVNARWIDSHPFIKQLIQTYGPQVVQKLLPFILQYLQPKSA